MTDTTTADGEERALFEQWHAEERTQPLNRYEDSYKNAHVRARWEGWQARAAIDAAPSREAEALQIDPVDNATGETMCLVRFFIETPAGWVGAHDKAALECLLAAGALKQEPAVPAGFPPRILRLIREAACREPEGYGAWQDEHGEPLQDDADAALAWIAARAKEGKA